MEERGWESGDDRISSELRKGWISGVIALILCILFGGGLARLTIGLRSMYARESWIPRTDEAMNLAVGAGLVAGAVMLARSASEWARPRLHRSPPPVLSLDDDVDGPPTT